MGWVGAISFAVSPPQMPAMTRAGLESKPRGRDSCRFPTRVAEAQLLGPRPWACISRKLELGVEQGLKPRRCGTTCGCLIGTLTARPAAFPCPRL